MTTVTKSRYETSVPEYFEKVRDLVCDWAEHVTEEVGNWDECGGADANCVHEVENKSRDGFIPYTSGGFDACIPAYMSYAWGSGNVPNAIQPYIDSTLEDAKKEWDGQNPQHTYEWIFGEEDESERRDMFGKILYTERDHWREKYSEHESEWMDGTYFYKIRALFHNGGSRTRSLSGEPEVLFCVAINTDFDYGRDTIPWLSCYGGNPQQSKWVWEKTVPAKKITPKMIERFKKEAIEALRRA